MPPDVTKRDRSHHSEPEKPRILPFGHKTDLQTIALVYVMYLPTILQVTLAFAIIAVSLRVWIVGGAMSTPSAWPIPKS